ncbi:SDR family oxidoreductase [Nocardioides coralli]|uniref:SDR family oxidoreductase n=1 Tax=Nocardioides coralli TaxID=2872154 RepID=UPI001CA40D63|nr:NmrA family NAD(P)-binding protein [Nocardioides coralli]QZY30087.1 NAD(P)H-binding protein [Nocardioides coralli]
MTTTVAVVGGSGKTGRVVRAALTHRGAASFPTGRDDWDALARALAPADRLYLVAPNLHPDEPAYVAAVLEAAHAAGIERVVYHSVAAPHAPAMPHHLAKAEAEDLVRRSGLGWTVLQPGAYVQNLPLDGSPVRVPYRADVPFGFAHLPDVGEAAAAVLLGEGHEGATYELASFRASVAEVAGVVGAPVEVLTPEAWAAGEGAGLDARRRTWLLAMFAYYDQHGLPVGTGPISLLLGGPPTPLRAACSLKGDPARRTMDRGPEPTR